MSAKQPQSESMEEQLLNALIGQWSKQNRLTEGRAETIRRRVVASSVALHYEWWWNFFRNIGLMKGENVRSTAGAIFGNTAFAGTFQQIAPSHSWSSQASADFTPYLRPLPN